MAELEKSKNIHNTNVRHDWYQSETHIIINILHKNIKETDLKVDFQSNTLNVSFSSASGEHYNLHLNLSYEVVPSECTYKLLASKIEVKLKKKEGFRWVKLEGDTSSILVLKNAAYGEAALHEKQLDELPSKQPKNWDKVVSDITNTDEYKLQSEDAVNALFQKIYSDGSDEVKKAMNKSFVESNGTVLSTNWDEVKTDKVDCKPPDGVEWKKWDS